MSVSLKARKPSEQTTSTPIRAALSPIGRATPEPLSFCRPGIRLKLRREKCTGTSELIPRASGGQ